jgi:acyl-CoA synthetase (AMP-forming)/AMP-acid ligase II
VADGLLAGDLALLIYTSGTTGSPKGVMLTHANLDAMTSSFIEWFDMDEHDHGLLILPLFPANGIVLGTLSPLRAGGQVTISRRFARDRFFGDVERYRPTFFSAVPAIYTMLNSAADEVHPDMSSVRFAVCGAAPMPAEVVIAGPVVMAGYLGRPDETARTIVGGWLHTGDIGRFDEDGYLQIVDRIKDMIIRGGENVYPKEIENAFYSNPDVHEVAVVGAPHAVFGEVPQESRRQDRQAGPQAATSGARLVR